ncbi:MAG TPA: hypothetical protein VFO36_13410, partial [Nitrospiraceae bacterium]|nr:hypothetical protein [Nitrospiraceae bacterium]
MDIRRFWSRPRRRAHALLSIAVVSLASGIAAGKPHTSPMPVPYPEGFRDWTHVKSALVWPETVANAPFSGLHNIYA